jgi:hypothetical protein
LNLSGFKRLDNLDAPNRLDFAGGDCDYVDFAEVHPSNRKEHKKADRLNEPKLYGRWRGFQKLQGGRKKLAITRSEQRSKSALPSGFGCCRWGCGQTHAA